MYMEFSVGQLTQRGPIGAMSQICPLFKGTGIATVVISFLLTTYYIVIIAWVCKLNN
jgi:solute carrier family 6 GABA transporter-like protein 6/8/11/12/13